MTLTVSRVAGKTAVPEEFFPHRLIPAGTPAESGIVSGEVPDLKSAATQLACLLQQIQNVTSRASKMVSERSEIPLTSSVHSNCWSVAECFDHLAVTTDRFAPLMSAAIVTAPKLTKDRELRLGSIARLLVRTLEPPYRLRHKVLACLVPQNRDFPSAWRNFIESQAQLAQVVRSAMGLAIDQVRIQSPACTRVSYSVYGALEILTAHQRRHLWQVERILADLDRSDA
jgi:DinB superfamily